MRQRTIRIAQWIVLGAAPVALMAFSTGPPIRRTGAPVDDNGTNCTACHRDFPVNSGPGRVTIRANGYTPGVKQNITIEITDPNALRWGFEITSRVASNETRQAGSFTATDLIRVVCAPNTSPAPCNGELEFATHRQANTRAGSGGPQTFVLEWTPPNTDVGEIIFYAAGNAANNSNTNVGDRIYTTSLKISAAGPPCGLTEKPTIRANGIVNAASFAPGVSSNSLITVFGGGFHIAGESIRAARSDLVAGKLPTRLGCVGLEVNGKIAPVFYVQGDQLNAQAPILDGTGPIQVRAILNPGTPQEIRGDPVTISAAAFTPAFFTFRDGRSIAALNASDGNKILANPTLVEGGVFAKPGDVVVLYGTGFGFTDPVYQPGEFADGAARLREPITVTIGGTTLAAADILYAGLSPDAPGFYQFNVRVPATVSDGNVPVSIRIGGVSTQADTTIPIRR